MYLLESGDAAGLAEGDDPPPVEVEQLVQLHQGIPASDLIIHNSSFIIVLMLCLALGGFRPGWAGGAVEGGEVFYGGGE